MLTLSSSPLSVKTLSSSPLPVKLKRNQRQVREGLYLKLGLIQGTPVSGSKKQRQEDEETTPCRRSSLKKRTSVLHSKRPQSVSFSRHVQVTEIPSHRELDLETWCTIWNFPATVKEDMARSKFEFWADGGDWRTVTEEDGMYCDGRDGSLVHPATWARMEAYQPEAYYDYATPVSYDYVQQQQMLQAQQYSSSNNMPLPSYRKSLQRRRRKSWEQPQNQNKNSYHRFVGAHYQARYGSEPAMTAGYPHMPPSA